MDYYCRIGIKDVGCTIPDFLNAINNVICYTFFPEGATINVICPTIFSEGITINVICHTFFPGGITINVICPTIFFVERLKSYSNIV